MEIFNLRDIPQNVLVAEHPDPANPRFIDSIKRGLELLSRRAKFNLEIVPSPRNESEANQLVREFNDDTEIIVLGGDGTVRGLYTAMHNAGIRNLRLNALGGGGACDFARQVHTNHKARSLDKVLRSPALPHKPILTTVEHPDIDALDNRIEIVSSLYFALGFTARMAEIYNQPEFRESVRGINPGSRKFIQGFEILKTIKHADLFDLEYENRPPAEVGEYVFPNGSRMAGGIVRFKGNPFFGPQFGELAVGEINYPNFVKGLARATFGLYTKHQDGEEVRFKVSSKDEAPILYQSDGESGTFPSGSIVSVRLGDAVVNTVTSNAFDIGLEQAA